MEKLIDVEDGDNVILWQSGERLSGYTAPHPRKQYSSQAPLWEPQIQYIILIFLIGIVGGGVQLGPLGTAATNGLLCQPRVIMMEKLVEWLAGETEVLGENLPSAALSTTNPTCCPDANPGRRGGKPASNSLSYGTAKSNI
jgi:hypothetical protein